MLKHKYLNYKLTVKDVQGSKICFFTDENGKCFYDLMDELDSEVGQHLIVGCQHNGWVNFVTTGKLSGVFAPHDGSSIYVFELEDTPEGGINENGMRLKVVDDNLVRVLTYTSQPERTKDDILRDLDRLREELLSTKE